MKNLRILFCASEVSPYAKTGGLADVAGALPPALRQLGCDVRIFTPLHRVVREKVDRLSLLAEEIPIPVGAHDYHAHLWESRTSTGIPIYFMEKEEFFDRAHLYGAPIRGDYEDNAERFITFCRAVFPLCEKLDWIPDIFHIHDWQTALIAPYLDAERHNNPNFAHSGTVFTIHNLAYQGVFPAAYFPLTGLPAEAFSLRGLEFWGQCNFLKGGLVYSDFLTTVSPRYSKEIQQHRLGAGLEGVLLERSQNLAGILNGVDYTAWDPERDSFLTAHYSAEDLSGKRSCKEALIKDLGMSKECADMPLLGMISRLDPQKGFDLVIEILEDLMDLPLSLIILGSGDAKIEKRLQRTARHYPDRIRALFQFNEEIAHKIEAAADIFLMPSRYEPCGLNQLYSLRYGTIPVVHATGGLDDSVADVLRDPDSGTGFKFYNYEASEFLSSVQAAFDLYQSPPKWLALQKRAMAQDFSWDRSAKEYLKIYEKVSDLRSSAASPAEQKALAEEA